MSFLIHCTLLLSALVSLLLSCSLCIKAPAAASASPAACPPPCSLPPPLSTLSPNSTFSVFDNHIPFTTSSVFSLSVKLSSSSIFTMDFTMNFTDAESGDCPPTLVFTLLPSLRPFMELNFDFGHDNRRELPFPTAGVCKSEEFQRQLTPTATSACPEPAADAHPFHSKETHFIYAVSLTYHADSAEFHVQAVINHPFECNQTFILNITGLQPADADADSISLFVGFAPTTNYDAHANNSNNSKSNHNIKVVVVWVIVGVSMLAFFVGLIILALSIKRHRRRPSLVSSRSSPGHLLVPPSTTTKAPFPHRHFESSATPMMMALPPSPPYHTNAFQMSGTASWLKQANPR